MPSKGEKLLVSPAHGLTEAQLAELDKPLDAAIVKSREKQGVRLSYIEGHHAIREANRIFGFAGWRRETREMRLVAERPYVSSKNREGFLVAYVARVAVLVRTEEGEVESDGWGYGEGIDYTNIGQAHESAVKEAETDAMKRALVKWGDPFGLALYDKAKEHVENGGGNGDGAKRQPARQPRAASPSKQPSSGYDAWEGEEVRVEGHSVSSADEPEGSGSKPACTEVRKFKDLPEFFVALDNLGFRTTKEKLRLKQEAGLTATWPEMGVGGWNRVYELAVVQSGGIPDDQ